MKLLSGFGFNLSLEQVDFFDVLLMLVGHQYLQVVSLELQQFLILLVINEKKFVVLCLDLLLEEHIKIGRVHQGNSEISWEDDVHDVDLLDENTVWVELCLKLLHHLGGELSLDVSYSGDLDLLEEVSDLFIALFLEQFFKSVRPKVVEELFGIFFVYFLGHIRSSNMKVNTNINGDSDVVFGRNVSDWALEPDCVFGDHHGHSFVATITASISWLHDTVVFTPNLLKSIDTIRDVKFVYTATRWVFHNNHYRNAISMRFSNQTRCFFGIVSVKLDQVCLSSKFTLDIVIELILSGHEVTCSLHLLLSLSLLRLMRYRLCWSLSICLLCLLIALSSSVLIVQQGLLELVHKVLLIHFY